MAKFIVRRLIVSIPLLLGLTILVFAMVHLLPGDPAEVILAARQPYMARVDDLETTQLQESPWLEEIERLYGMLPGAIERTAEIADRCRFSLDELRYEYPEELCPPGRTPPRRSTGSPTPPTNGGRSR